MDFDGSGEDLATEGHRALILGQRFEVEFDRRAYIDERFLDGADLGLTALQFRASGVTAVVVLFDDDCTLRVISQHSSAGNAQMPPGRRDSMKAVRVIEARYEEGVLRPREPLSLRSGESVNLIVVRRPDLKRWDLARIQAGGTAEDLALAEQGLPDWADALDREDCG